MSAIEAQLLFLRMILLLLLYAFLGGVGIVAWRDLQAARRSERAG